MNLAASTSSQSAPTKSEWQPEGAVFSLVLILATLAAYWPALRGEFLWDDDSWTTGISGLLRDTAGLSQMWTKLGALQQYYPLSGTSFWLDYHLWGFRPLPYHVENVLLHIVAALLFWKLLRRLFVPGAWLAAFLFALHPAMVESVAWITERKNVLSLVLYLGALLAYGRYTNYWAGWNNLSTIPATGPRARWGCYGLALALFAGALLSKITAFSLPAVLLLICWWRQGCVRLKKDFLPTLPFFALATVVGLVAKWVETNHIGARGVEFALSWPERFLIAGRAPWFYAAELVWPANLCFVYPRWHLDPASIGQWLFLAALILVCAGLWLARKRVGRGPLAAALFFVGTLFPVMGFLNAYFMRFSFVCDHWVYLSSLGPIALAAAAIIRAAKRLQAHAIVYSASLFALVGLGALTWQQSTTYLNSETLWRTAVSGNPSAFLALNNLGLILGRRGQLDEAMVLFKEAVQAKPDYREALSNVGNSLLHQGQTKEALVYLRRAKDSGMNDPGVYVNLGNGLFQAGEVDQAVAQYQTALKLDPEHVEAHNNLGVVLLHKQQPEEAAKHFEEALKARPVYAEAHFNLGVALLKTGKADSAVAELERALSLQPEYPEARDYLAKARGQGRAPP